MTGWGGRIRTCDPGTKTRCLATWPRPNANRADPMGLDTARIAASIPEHFRAVRNPYGDRTPRPTGTHTNVTPRRRNPSAAARASPCDANKP